MTPNKVKKENYTKFPEEVIDKEKKYLGLNDEKLIFGLAVSGGGIRSASFGLGVMQALVANNQLEKIDYLSTVSGGGYLGSALTWALHLDKNAGTKPNNFPLGKRGTKGGKNIKGENDSLHEDDNKLLDFIRQHGSYLTPTKSLDIISFAAVIMRSMIMSLFVYLSFITIMMTASLWAVYYFASGTLEKIKVVINKKLGIEVIHAQQGLLIFVAVIILIIILFLGFMFSINTFFSSDKAVRFRYSGFIKGQKTIGLLLKLFLVCLVLGSLPFVVQLMKGIINPFQAAGGSTFLGTIVGIWQYLKARNNNKSSGGVSNTVIYFGAFALFYGVLLFAYVFATTYFLKDLIYFINPVWFFTLLAATLVFGIFVNLNFIGPHYIWRSRLMETFMPNKESVLKNQWMPASEANSALMENMCNADNPKPYHLVNTNAILCNSSQIDYSGRGGDNFIISRLYCGSDATGWKTTETFQNRITSGISLASAMATSAAALNPNAGVSGEGVTRNLVVSILLSMLNLRLGYWTSNPSRENTLGSPNFIIPGLTSEIFRTGLNETNKNLQLSDGGHYENLGLYELIRRNLDVIIVSDGGADPNFNFDDLANAIEKVRVDFGARIKFRQNCETGDILPGSAGHSLFHIKYNISKHGYAIADIIYKDQKKGVLLYIKLAMIDGLSTDVYSYKGIHPTFPHQCTADQFFDEKQFEAYRELGYYVGWQLMESEEGEKVFDMQKEKIHS